MGDEFQRNQERSSRVKEGQEMETELEIYGGLGNMGNAGCGRQGDLGYVAFQRRTQVRVKG